MNKNIRKMKILMVLPTSADPFMHPVYHSMFKDMIAEHFPKMRNEIIWITEQRNKPNKNQMISWKRIRCYVMTAPFHNKGFFRKFGNTLFIYIDKFLTLRKITRNEKIDIIQVRNGIIDGLLALHFRKRNKSIIVFQLSFPSAERMILYPHLIQGKSPFITYIHGKINKIMINWILFKVEMILPISKWMKMKMEKEGIPKDKMFPLPLGHNPIEGKNGLLIRKKYNLDGCQVLIYVGSIDRIRNLGFIIRVFEIVKDKTKSVKMLMVGDGSDKNNLEKLSNKMGLDEDIIFTGFIDRDLVQNYIAAADIGLSPIVPLPIYEASSPTKAIEYMGEGKPLVANEEILEQKEVLEESGGGILVKFEEEAFASGIIKLLDNPSKAKEMGIKGQTWVRENRSYENMAREVEKRYFKLLESHSRR
jgi:glycosyltransferase involved in cell wall biosynthesis